MLAEQMADGADRFFNGDAVSEDIAFEGLPQVVLITM